MTSSDIITKCLDGAAYTNINHNMILGLDGNVYEAFMLSHLMGMYSYFLSQGMLSQGWFYQTIDDVISNCGISESKQRRALDNLKTRGLIQIRLAGSPPKRHFKIDPDKIVELFGKTLKKEVVPELKVNKEEFYDTLNKALTGTLTEFFHVTGSIPRKIALFMFNWSGQKLLKDCDYKWNPKDYGILRNYWRARYSKKEFDYSRISKFFEEFMPGSFISSFISWDREQLDNPPSKCVTYFDLTGEKE